MIGGILGSLVLGLPGVAGKLLDVLAKRADAGVQINGQNVSGDVSIAQAQLAAYVEERKVIAAERARQSESLWTAWMIPAAFGFCLWHFGAVVLDSVHHFGWEIARLPPPYADLQVNIIVAVVGIKAGAVAVRRIFGR